MLRFFDSVLIAANEAHRKAIRACIKITEQLVQEVKSCREAVFDQETPEGDAVPRLTETIRKALSLEQRLATELDAAVAASNGTAAG